MEVVNSRVFIQSLSLIALFIIVDGIFFGLFSAFQENSPFRISKIGNYVDRVWRLGLIYTVFKIVFGYFLILLLFAYLTKSTLSNFSTVNFLMAIAVIFLFSVGIMFLHKLYFVENGSISNAIRWLKQGLVYKPPLGGDLYIAFFSSLLSPILVKFVSGFFK